MGRSIIIALETSSDAKNGGRANEFLFVEPDLVDRLDDQ
jgi:hypothetical protein